MAHPVEKLIHLPLFRRVPAEAIRAVQPLFRPVRVPSGKRLWAAGDKGDRLGILVAGQLRARLEGQHLCSVRRGEVFGEAGAFFGEGRRTADLVSDGDCKVVLFTRGGLEQMRLHHTAVYDALLEDCVRLLAERIRATTLALAKLAPGGVHRPVRQERSSLSRMWRAIVPGGPSGRCPRLVPLLRRRPTMTGVPESVLRTIAGQFQERAIEQGEVICLEGETVNGAWIVAEGGVDIIRNVGGERAEHLATIKVGDLFGHNGLQSVNSQRTASCVASRAGWLYEIQPAASRALDGEAWRVWNETLLYSYIEQIRRSNLALGSLVVGTREQDRVEPATSEELGSILNARSALAGGSIDEELDQVEFVVDEAARREGYRKR